jgi:hypothetical protein
VTVRPAIIALLALATTPASPAFVTSEPLIF